MKRGTSFQTVQAPWTRDGDAADSTAQTMDGSRGRKGQNGQISAHFACANSMLRASAPKARWVAVCSKSSIPPACERGDVRGCKGRVRAGRRISTAAVAARGASVAYASKVRASSAVIDPVLAAPSPPVPLSLSGEGKREVAMGRLVVEDWGSSADGAGISAPAPSRTMFSRSTKIAARFGELVEQNAACGVDVDGAAQRDGGCQLRPGAERDGNVEATRRRRDSKAWGRRWRMRWGSFS